MQDLDIYGIRKMHIMIPAVIFDKLCKKGMMNDIDSIVTRLLIKELSDGDINGKLGNNK